jgi:hypothetical protein
VWSQELICCDRKVRISIIKKDLNVLNIGYDEGSNEYFMMVVFNRDVPPSSSSS